MSHKQNVFLHNAVFTVRKSPMMQLLSGATNGIKAPQLSWIPQSLNLPWSVFTLKTVDFGIFCFLQGWLKWLERSCTAMYGYLPQRRRLSLEIFLRFFLWVCQRLRVSNTVLVIGKFKVLASGKAAVLRGEFRWVLGRLSPKKRFHPTGKVIDICKVLFLVSTEVWVGIGDVFFLKFDTKTFESQRIIENWSSFKFQGMKRKAEDVEKTFLPRGLWW